MGGGREITTARLYGLAGYYRKIKTVEKDCPFCNKKTKQQVLLDNEGRAVYNCLSHNKKQIKDDNFFRVVR